MTALEIIMLIIGIVCFVSSFILMNDDAESVVKHKENYKPELTKEQIEQITEHIDEIVANQITLAEESTEAALDKISNTKIMEMNEYAESVFHEINKNHNETVFMYDMLNDKSKEIKNIIKDINSVKADIEVSRVAVQENKAQLEGLVQESAMIVKEMGVAIKVAHKSKNAVAQKAEETENHVLNNVIKPQFFEQNPETDTKSEVQPEMAYMAKAEPEGLIANYNDQILMMHKQGKSNLEIAKSLNLGMGEVKLVIDLFNKNR